MAARTKGIRAIPYTPVTTDILGPIVDAIIETFGPSVLSPEAVRRFNEAREHSEREIVLLNARLDAIQANVLDSEATSTSSSSAAVASSSTAGSESVDEEDLTDAGTVTGTVFTCDYPPDTGSLKVYLNGQRLVNGEDYSLSSSTITVTSAALVARGGVVAGDVFVADYRRTVA